MASIKKTGEIAPENQTPTKKSAPDNTIAQLAAAQTQEALLVLFAWRIINAILVRTFFQPDEYFQSLEPAWRMVFGEQSGAWITWEWRHSLRSSLHPAVFSIVYFIVDNALQTNSIKATWLTLAPKVLQSGLACLGDWYTWRFAEKLFGPSSPLAWSTLLMSLLNPWQWYTATRTFSSCLESVLTIVALYYWPWEILGEDEKETSNAPDKTGKPPLLSTWKQVNNLRLSLLLAALAVLLRPTNALIWLAIGTLVLTRATLDGQSTLSLGVFFILARETILCGGFALGLSMLSDRAFYGDWVFPPYHWLHFNLAQGLAVFYGQNDWHYFLSQGLPLLSTTILPFVLLGLFNIGGSTSSRTWPVTTTNALRTMSYAVLTTVASLSLISHKEVRFITPLLPMLHILAAPSITGFFTTALDTAANVCPPPKLKLKRTYFLAAGLIVNVIIGGYLAYFHSSAPISVMYFLRKEFEQVHPSLAKVRVTAADAAAAAERQDEVFAFFLTPCHATPWRSHLVYPQLHARALSCEPPLDSAPGSPERAAYMDETSLFYADQMGFLANLWSATPRSGDADHVGVGPEPVPRYIVAYEGLEDALRDYFENHHRQQGNGGDAGVLRLQEVWRSGWNGLFTDDDRKSGRIVVWATSAYDEKDQKEGDAAEL